MKEENFWTLYRVWKLLLGISLFVFMFFDLSESVFVFIMVACGAALILDTLGDYIVLERAKKDGKKR